MTPIYRLALASAAFRCLTQNQFSFAQVSSAGNHSYVSITTGCVAKLLRTQADKGNAVFPPSKHRFPMTHPGLCRQSNMPLCVGVLTHDIEIFFPKQHFVYSGFAKKEMVFCYLCISCS